jgi:hypothetical protein
MAKRSVLATVAVTLLLVGFASAFGHNGGKATEHMAAMHGKHVKDVSSHFTKVRALSRRFGAQQSSGVLQSGGVEVEVSGDMTPACVQSLAQAEAKVKAACGDSEESFGQLLNASAPTSAITAVCAANCQTELKAARVSIAACSASSDELVGIDMVTSLCTMDNGQTCAARLRTWSALNDCSFFTTSSDCSNNTKCYWKTAPADDSFDGSTYSSCQPILNAATLQEVCTSCLDRLMLILGRQQGADGATLLIASKNLMCMKSGSTFCTPLLNSLDPRIIIIDMKNNMSGTELTGNVSAICANTDQKKCMQMAGVQAAAAIRAWGDFNYKQCVSGASWYASSCQSSWYSNEKIAIETEQQFQFLCSTNDAGNLCMNQLQTFIRVPCVKALETSGCNSTCAPVVQELVNSSRCCLRRFRDMQNVRPDYARLPLVSGSDGSITPPSNPSVSTDEGVQDFITQCASANLTGYNATALGALANTSCSGPKAALPRKELSLKGIAWSQVNSSIVIKASIEASCRADVAARLGVTESRIVNASLQADSSQSLAVRRTSGRRQSSNWTTTTGTKFVFQVGGDSDAEVTANAAAFDSAQASNSIQLPATASVIINSCSTCVAAPAAAPGQTPAPVSTDNLFASMTGGDTSGTTSPSGSSSSAASAAVIGATVAAVALICAL